MIFSRRHEAPRIIRNVFINSTRHLNSNDVLWKVAKQGFEETFPVRFWNYLIPQKNSSSYNLALKWVYHLIKDNSTYSETLDDFRKISIRKNFSLKGHVHLLDRQAFYFSRPRTRQRNQKSYTYYPANCPRYYPFVMESKSCVLYSKVTSCTPAKNLN